MKTYITAKTATVTLVGMEATQLSHTTSHSSIRSSTLPLQTPWQQPKWGGIYYIALLLWEHNSQWS